MPNKIWYMGRRKELHWRNKLLSKYNLNSNATYDSTWKIFHCTKIKKKLKAPVDLQISGLHLTLICSVVRWKGMEKRKLFAWLLYPCICPTKLILMMIAHYTDRERKRMRRVRERKESGKGVREWVGESKVKSERSNGENEEKKWRERMR